jgi:hypothetical protein
MQLMLYGSVGMERWWQIFFVAVFHEASKALRVSQSRVLTNVPSIMEAVTARRMDAVEHLDATRSTHV